MVRSKPVSYTHLDVYKRQVQADGVRPAVLFDDNRLSVIVTGMHGLVDSATFVRQGQVLLSVDARFLSTEWAGGFVGCMAGFMA